ncbi:helix-turn-helix domain-containing protein [Mycolicibacterium conceptionense]|uniref:helix-turn-helix domain-containing protein n=1 Tax=Mycolicibacterium conceptionense TaxID=451644 RepID=UPI0013F4E1DE|nr:helix-turn-helix transcriptional regulator [Mycolicibacterium conceptionense]
MSTLQEWLPDPDRGEIGERLRAYMGVHKISRAALALKSGISRTPLSNKLDGKTDFTVEEVTAIANALGKSWIWVLTGRDPRPAGGPDDDGGVVRPKGFEPLTF